MKSYFICAIRSLSCPHNFVTSVLIFSFLSIHSVHAVEFEHGELYGSLDTTLSYGQSHRVQSRASELVGIANGGTAFSVNGDDGNLNYDSGLYSNTMKFTTELELNYRNFGAFIRGSGFRDMSSDDPSDTDRTPLSDDAIELVGEDLKLLDAYLRADFNLGSMPFELRLGEQVISWGESTFIQNSINVINPVDVSKLRLPGSELKEALLPVGIVSASLGVTENISLEAFYQYDYERILIDPPGSFFSTNDIAGNGGNRLFLGFGDISDQGTLVPGPATIAGIPIPAIAATAPLYAGGGTDGLDAGFGAVDRGFDIRPGEGGEFGAALRLFAPQLNDTEFGFYFINYHSRLPILSARAGSIASIGNAATAALAATCVGGLTDPALAAACMAAGGAVGFPVAVAPTAAAIGTGFFGADNAINAAANGANCAFSSAALGPAFSSTTGFVGNPAGFAQQCALTQFADSANYFVEYPEDIKLFGLSFNTELGTTGIALQGEYSFRNDAPLQIDFQELLLAAGTVLNNNPVLAASPTIAGTTNNQITNGAVLPPGTVIPGFIERDISQVQMTATKVFGPTLGADTSVLVGEFAVTHVHNMPSKGVLRLEAPGTDTTGNPFHSTAIGFHPGKASVPSDHYPDATSWGYQIRGQLQYLGALGSINVLPRFAWRHDVSGITPGPGGNFLEGRKAISLGLGFTYQNDWQADLSYTSFFGAGEQNLLQDRDFTSFSISYSF